MTSHDVLIVMKDLTLEVAGLSQAALTNLDLLSDEEVVGSSAIDFAKGYRAAIHDVADILARAASKLNEMDS